MILELYCAGFPFVGNDIIDATSEVNELSTVPGSSAQWTAIVLDPSSTERQHATASTSGRKWSLENQLDDDNPKRILWIRPH